MLVVSLWQQQLITEGHYLTLSDENVLFIHSMCGQVRVYQQLYSLIFAAADQSTFTAKV